MRRHPLCAQAKHHTCLDGLQNVDSLEHTGIARLWCERETLNARSRGSVSRVQSLEPVQELELATQDHITAVVSLQQFSWAVSNSGAIVTFQHNNPDEANESDLCEDSELAKLDANFTKKEFEAWIRQLLSDTTIGMKHACHE